MEETVFILMASYNGEKYISEQIKSIIDQTYSNWKLVIRDDNSTDQTRDIIERYVREDQRIEACYGEENLGQVGNFRKLMERCDTVSYTMLCDQDDVWKKDKVERTLKRMLDEEKKHPNVPILIYTDRQLVDEKLVPLGIRTREHKVDLFSLLCQNPIYGCTMMMNRALSLLVKQMPDYVVNHDYWISLNAAAEGVIEKLEYDSILYRLHAENVTGGINNYSLLYKLKNWKITNQGIRRTVMQNYLFCKRIGPQNLAAEKYMRIVEAPRVLRIITALRNGYHLDRLLATCRSLAVIGLFHINAK